MSKWGFIVIILGLLIYLGLIIPLLEFAGKINEVRSYRFIQIQDSLK